MGMLCVAALALVWVPASPVVVASGLSSAHVLTGGVQPESMPGEVIDPDRQTEGSFAIPPHVVNESPPILRLRVKKVVNPDNTAFQILVYLSAGADQDEEAARTRVS